MRCVATQKQPFQREGGVVRRGLTLIEVAIVMSVGALLSGIAVSTLAAMLHADREFSDRGASRVQMTDIAAAMRRDIAQAEGVAWHEDKQLLELLLANNVKLAYRLFPDRWERRVLGGDRGADSSGTLTLALPTPRRMACRVEPAAAAAGDLVTIVLLTRGRIGARHAPQTDFEIAAVVGRDGRLLQE